MVYDKDRLFLNLISERFTGVPATSLDGGIYTSELRSLLAIVMPPPHHEVYPVPVPQESQPAQFTGNNNWRNPVWNPSTSADIQGLQQDYGFNRAYYGNTHHYFFYINLIYAYGAGGMGTFNYEKEKIDLNDPLSAWRANPQEPDFAQRYAWAYQEAVNDLYITDQAARVAAAIRERGLDALPDMLEQDACTQGDDLWAVQERVNAEYYFRFPESYWPAEEYWPTGR